MSASVLTRTVALPPVCEKEVLRYAGSRGEDASSMLLLQTCLQEAAPCLLGSV